MAPKRPFTATRLQHAASSSAEDARRDLAAVLELTCGYPFYITRVAIARFVHKQQ